MTASNVEFFACRVPLVGRTQSASSREVPPTVTVSATALPPVQRICRNLFGSPKPGAINQLLQEETERKLSNFRQRYVIINTVYEQKSAQQIPQTTENNEQKSSCSASQLSCLIAQEQQQHEQRLKQQRRDEVTPPNQNCKIRRTNESSSCNDDAELHNISVANNNSNDRLKPYDRQTKLTDIFNLRKTPQFNGKNAMTMSSSASQRRQVVVLELPKPMRASVNTSSSAIAIATAKTAKASPAPSDNNNTQTDSNVTLSLQVVATDLANDSQAA